MYVDGYLLFAIYFIAVLSLAVSVYAVWSLEEIRQYYAKRYNKNNTFKMPASTKNIKSKPKSHWD